MAAALRKLLRSSNGKLERKSDKKDAGSPGQPVARRLLARACSTVQGYRDATKVSPAENTNVVNAPMINNHRHHHHHHHHYHHRWFSKGRGSGVTLSGGAADGAVVVNGLLNGKPTTKKKKGESGSGAVPAESTAAHAKLVRTRRLMREFQEMSKHQRESASPLFTVELANDNLYEWSVKLHRIDPESDLYRDMCETKTPYILLNLSFPDNFPFAPPFMRVITPRIEKGFVMDGGAICMELLTPSGWASAYTVEAIVMQFSASLVKGQGRIVRKAKGGKSFNKKAAEASFRSLVKTHDKYGWVTPPMADG